MKRFADKVAVVTGGGGGIGAAICRRLASEGATVVAVDISGPGLHQVISEITAGGGVAEAVVVDVGDAKECRLAVEKVLSRHQRVDVLANNAGIFRGGNLLAVSEDDWKSSFAVNLDALFHLCRAVLPSMVERGTGAIVNTSSQWGLHPAPGSIVYNVTKAAVASFTQNLARDYAPAGIRVNAVCPGEIYTPMMEAGMKRSGQTIEDKNKLVPFGRVGTPEEVAALVAFLASDEALFLCGSLVEITGAQAVA
ncbi:SDR family NAD(P)-dependent oxidoreductase [Phyllobacterium endophyticum]|uniref:SDR family NAD(P)-dependent oxidoreductase n=1 Tax=Phyllobacterium endophyticum TaxID=1149773 RepID=UPI0011C7C3E6|nr:SDR family NAD(P)-dependent oxidoreductase [Phyllobacterium endophyticum]TXR50559.1 SDR family oxidoreductase [Phyllobacterium endophyticum]